MAGEAMSVADSAGERAQALKRYICTQCGYIYDPAAGDSMNGIPAGTAFEDLPSEWVCPMCYAGRELFDVLD